MIGVGAHDIPDEADHLQMLQSKQIITNNVVNQRKDQMDRWKSSEMDKASSIRRHTDNSKVKFCEGDIFLSACISGDEEEVEELIDRGADINTCTIDGVTALHQAVIDEKYDTVKFLVDHCADINVQDNEGWTPLHAAVCCSNVDIVRYLCQKGADLTIVNSDRELPIDLAKDDECKQFLEEEYSRQRITYDECRDHEFQLMKNDCADWIARGVFEDHPHHRTGATALHVAAAKNYIQLIVPLVKAGADVHARDFDGWTPLHAAAHWGHAEICRLLVENGANFDDTNYAGDGVMRVADKMVLNELEEIEAELKKGLLKPAQVLQANNSLFGNRKSSRSEEKLQIASIRGGFEQNENSASTSHEFSPPPAKKQETDNRRSGAPDNSQYTTSAHVELNRKSDDVHIESGPIRLPTRRLLNDEEDELSKDSSVSSVDSKSSTASSGQDSDRNLVSTSEDVSKSCSEISQVSSSSDFTTRLPLLESSSENAVLRPTKLVESLKRNYIFSSKDSPSREASTSSAERSSSCLSSEMSSVTKESSNSPHVEFTVRMKGPRAGWLQDGRRADSKKTVSAIVGPSIRSGSSNTSSTPPLNSPSPIQSPMQRKASWQTPPMQPSQKDEREAERKAKSRMQRATRRSTQAITAEDLNSARSWKSSTLSQEESVDSDQEVGDDREADKRGHGSVTESSSNSSVTADSTTSNRPMSALTPSAAHLRRRSHVNRANRRSTGPVSMEDLQAASCSLSDRITENGNGIVVPSVRLTNHSQATELETPLLDSIDYRLLYEDERKANEKLVKQMESIEKKLAEAERKISAMQLIKPSLVPSSLDEKDKRFYDRKIEELEHKTKDYDQIRNDNKRLKEENGALIRVISKLSK
ncbi:hypothetical protein QR680_001431 [Steinernema hermaphroditum]|uniref:cGMP-dependent protein kinase interacting domain-containing protein n=1 Tax=Steinernema hermaphroditum TaxID=289476 RepID=A0AA39LG12_9BILA|nr:hypothetical protein QR680_001431 [Steinernema hermaphroditum]